MTEGIGTGHWALGTGITRQSVDSKLARAKCPMPSALSQCTVYGSLRVNGEIFTSNVSPVWAVIW